MKSSGILLTAVALLCFAQSAHARTWYIKLDGTGDAPTIQAGIDSAQAGDDVLVGPGTYTWANQGATSIYGMINILTKSGIWLHSEAGPEMTVLGGEPHGGSVIWCSYADSVIIEGFTITGGVRDAFPGDGGGGVHCDNSSIEIVSNIITANMAANVFEGAGGGGIYCRDSADVLITNNIISGNSSDTYGGGIACFHCSPTITNNVIVGNTAQGDGGAVRCSFCDATISNNTISGNSATVGAAIHMEYGSSPAISRNIICGSLGGAALNCEGGSSPTVDCNDFWDNESGDGNCVLGGDNFSSDPMFCDEAGDDYRLHEDSPCAPANSPAGCGLVGAVPVGCWDTPISSLATVVAAIAILALGVWMIRREVLGVRF